jgi:hypothetical protein
MKREIVKHDEANIEIDSMKISLYIAVRKHSLHLVWPHISAARYQGLRLGLIQYSASRSGYIIPRLISKVATK